MQSDIEKAGLPVNESLEKVHETDINKYQNISVLASIKELQDKYIEKTNARPNIILLGYNTVLAFLYETGKDSVTEFDEDGTPVLRFYDDYNGDKIVVMPEPDYIGVSYKNVQFAATFFLNEEMRNMSNV